MIFVVDFCFHTRIELNFIISFKGTLKAKMIFNF